MPRGIDSVEMLNEINWFNDLKIFTFGSRGKFLSLLPANLNDRCNENLRYDLLFHQCESLVRCVMFAKVVRATLLIFRS